MSAENARIIDRLYRGTSLRPAEVEKEVMGACMRVNSTKTTVSGKASPPGGVYKPLSEWGEHNTLPVTADNSQSKRGVCKVSAARIFVGASNPERNECVQVNGGGEKLYHARHSSKNEFVT